MHQEFSDEDRFEMPAAWLRALPVLRAAEKPAEDAVKQAARRYAQEAAWFEEMFSSPGSDPELVKEGRAHREGSASPLGAAVEIAVGWHYTMVDALVDACVTEHGLPFAARAVVELGCVNPHYMQAGSRRYDPALRRTTDYQTYYVRETAARVRDLLAAVDEETRRRAVEALAGLRDSAERRIVVSYLVPEEHAWVDECCDGPIPNDSVLRRMLLLSLYRPEQIARIGEGARLGWNGWNLQLLAILANRLGPDVGSLLEDAFDGAYGSSGHRDVAGWAAELPNDDAFRLLLEKGDDRNVRPALLDAMNRYPRRALRLLSAAAVGDSEQASLSRMLLPLHVVTHPELTKKSLPSLPEASAAFVAPLLKRGERDAEAPAEVLPALLVTPPWIRKRTSRKARVARDVQGAPQAEMAWKPGEQQAWATAVVAETPWWREHDWSREIQQMQRGTWRGDIRAARLFVTGPEDVVRPLLDAFAPEHVWDTESYLRPVAARHGLHALPMLSRLAARYPATAGGLLLPYRSVEVARQMAEWLVRRKALRPMVLAWIRRHGRAAAALLVPDAVGPAGMPRTHAEHALRQLAAEVGAEAVREIAACCGAEAEEIVADLLAGDPLEAALPARMPSPCAWADPSLFPQIRLTGGRGALPADAVRHVTAMLQISKPGDVYPGLATVTEHCDAGSLAEFAWALFETWRFHGMPAKDVWALHALGFLGDDGTVRRLTPLVRAWPGENAHHRAVEGLTVLAAIGTDTALRHLHGIAQCVPFKALKKRARERIDEVAEGLGLATDRLADRLVPDLGLADDGSTVIDYGPRRFTVTFDEELRLRVRDETGKLRKALPAPGVKDDPELAPAERKRFAALKKEVRTIASDQLRRLEAAMVTGRSWTAVEFRELLVEHPLLRHLVRRLVWLGDADGMVTGFRVAEDLTLADVHDDAWTLPVDATVRLAHPLHLGGELEAWTDLFADHEILQPFPQLGRPVHAFTDAEATGHRLTRFEGVTVPVGKLLGLTKRGWERGTPEDNGVERWFSRPIVRDRHLVIALDDGIAVGMVDAFPDQTLETIWIDIAPGDYWRNHTYPHRLGEIDPVIASEILADLTAITAK
ncbi:DUF4132 domain-containing protein [Streptomyces sp. NBC_00236]|uniref:DUF4132 domain-containing protein n=1 Tax=unclassified Streptomyces TaxID=2593676 RepID=UPI002E2BD6D2|nr:DUF4132 domain-containing protein [Streptomyces sp. NBC_00236]